MQSHEQLLCFILLHISNSSVSTSLLGHVLYSADLMSATCFSYLFLMVHRYIYSRYSPVFLMLYQLYHSFLFSTLISSSSLYLSVTTWVTSQGHNMCFRDPITVRFDLEWILKNTIIISFGYSSFPFPFLLYQALFVYLIISLVSTCLVYNCETSQRFYYFHLLCKDLVAIT